MLAKVSRLNYRKGLFRLWVIGAVVWVVFAVTQKQSEVEYTARYAFDYDGLRQANQSYYISQEVELKNRLKDIETEEKARRAKELAEKPASDEYERALLKAGLPPSPKALPEARQNPFALHNILGLPQTPQEEITSINAWLKSHSDTTPTYPALNWLTYVFLPPPILGVVLLLAFYLIRFVLRWLGRGFAPR